MKSNRYVKDCLYCKYGKIDIFGYKPTKKLKLTCHHITPRRDGGKTNLENCVLLRDDMHRMLNWYEQFDKDNGDYINEYIQKVKRLKR